MDTEIAVLLMSSTTMHVLTEAIHHCIDFSRSCILDQAHKSLAAYCLSSLWSAAANNTHALKITLIILVCNDHL